MKSMRSKRIWLTAFLATAFMLFGAGVSTVDSVEASANNTVTAESVGLVMDKGAGVRLGSADGNNGIRFVLTMDKTEYSSLMEKVGTDEDDLYSEISFGMLITKASYVTDDKDLTVENVFGNDAVFEWKPEDADENWTVSDGKTLVVNQTFGYLGTSEDYENDYVGFASLVNLHDYNLAQEFIGRGYMKYTAKDGSVSYRMADYYEDARANNVRSMVYVAQKAAEDPKMADYKDTLGSLYINHSAVQTQTVDVTVKHHKLDVHGEEVGVETETVSGQKIGATVTATALTNEGWIYNEAKSTVSGVVYANGKTVLDLYYEQDPATVYDWYQVGKTAAVTNTLTLDEVVTGGIMNDEVELELSLDLLSGTMPRIKFYFLTAGDAQITDPATNGWITVADCYDETTGTYKFKTYFKWNSESWDIGKVFLQLEDGEYQLGIDVLSVNVLSDYDAIINKALAVTYNLPTPVTGAVYGDTVEITAKLTERATDLTKIHLTVLNKNGDTIAHNGNAYFTLADCVTEEENVYKFAMTFPWKGGDWDITAIKFTVDAATYVVGINIQSIEIVPVEYDLKYTAGTTHQKQAYTLETPVGGAIKGDTLEVVFSATTFYGNLNPNGTDIYFSIYNTSGEFIANSGWIDLTNCLVEGNTYKFAITLSSTADLTIAKLEAQISPAVKCGINIDNVSIIPVEYDFTLNKESTTTYTLPEAVTGMAQYGMADVTLKFVELTGDLTQVNVELLNANGDVVADNNGEYYTLADCATGVENEYAFKMISFAELSDYDIAAIRLTVDSEAYVVGGYYVGITTSAKDYDFVINKTNDYTYTLPEAVTGAVRYDTAVITVELTELVGDLTKLHLQIVNNDGKTVVSNNSNKYFTLADCATGEENTYAFALTFPWGNGNWDVTKIIFTVGDTAHVVGFNVKSVEIVPVEYDVKFTANAAHEQQTYTLASPIKAMKGDKLEIVFTMTNFYGTTNGASTDIYFYLNDALGNVAVTPGWLELTDILVEGTTYKAVADVTANVEIYSIKTQVKYAQMSGLNFETITVIAKDYDFVIDKANDYTYTLPETVTGAVRYDTMLVTAELTELVGDLTKLHIQLKNTAGTVVANNSNAYFTLANCATGEENVYTFALTFPWANGNWDISQIIFTVGDTEHVVGFNVKAVEVQEVAYQLEYSVASGSQSKVYAFDTVAGGTQNGYVKVTFDVAVFYGTLTNIQFNLCTNTAGSTTVANSNKAWAEDGTKITSSGGQISMSNLTGKKTVTIVTTFPWANGNWDLQSIKLQLYGTNLQAGVSNIQVELMPDFVPAA